MVFFHTGLPSPLAGKEAWDYVEVREGAHMFWWLYYADSQSAESKDLPLVMWLQVRIVVFPHSQHAPCFHALEKINVQALTCVT